MFDLDANPEAIAKVMQGIPHLGELCERYVGLRVGRSWDRFETLVTTVLGQLVSVSFGRTLTRELMQAHGERTVHPVTGLEIALFPTPQSLVHAELATLRTSDLRCKAIREIAGLAVDNTFIDHGTSDPKALRQLLRSITGVGAWSAEYIALRGFGDNDAFPATDYGLKQEIKLYPAMNVREAQPYRAYAAVALWKHFAETKGR